MLTCGCPSRRQWLVAVFLWVVVAQDAMVEAKLGCWWCCVVLDGAQGLAIA